MACRVHDKAWKNKSLRSARLLLKIQRGLNLRVYHIAGKGQSSLGMTILEGNRPVSAVVFSTDSTRGAKPILQIRYKMLTPDTAEKVLSGSMTINPNTACDDFIHAVSKRKGVHSLEHLEDGVHFTQTFNPNAASRHNLEMPTTEEFTDMTEHIGKQLKVINSEYLTLVTPKKVKPKARIARTRAAKKPQASGTKPVKGPVSFSEEAKRIIAFEGRTSVESAQKAKNLLMKRMGYDPNLITLKGKDLTNSNGYAYFDAITGEIVVDSAMAGKATHFDVADVLVHELQHMDDFVKVCKKMGIDEFEKLMMKLSNGDTFNRAFYEKAIQQADITGFDAKPFINEIKNRHKLISRNLTDEYARFMEKYEYTTSPMEIKARNAERRLIKELVADDVKIKGIMPLSSYGATPNEYLIDMMPKVESKLSKYPLAKRNDIFNKAHEQALMEQDPEFAALLKKLKTEGLNAKESTRYNELNKFEKGFHVQLLNRIIELL